MEIEGRQDLNQGTGMNGGDMSKEEEQDEEGRGFQGGRYEV